MSLSGVGGINGCKESSLGKGEGIIDEPKVRKAELTPCCPVADITLLSVGEKEVAKLRGICGEEKFPDED